MHLCYVGALETSAPPILLFYSFTFLLFYAVCWRVPIRASTTFTT